MDSPIDPVEKMVPYVPSDRVDHLHRHDRDKQRKFAKALQEELEDERRKKSRESDEDEVVIEGQDAAGQNAEAESGGGDEAQDDDSKPQHEVNEHIDVKA